MFVRCGSNQSPSMALDTHFNSDSDRCFQFKNRFVAKYDVFAAVVSILFTCHFMIVHSGRCDSRLKNLSTKSYYETYCIKRHFLQKPL